MESRWGCIEQQDSYIVAQRRRIQLLEQELLNSKEANLVKDRTIAKLESQLEVSATIVELKMYQTDFYKKQANKKTKPVILVED